MQRKTTYMAALVLVLTIAAASSSIGQQVLPPGLPADAGTEIGNLGTLPFMAQEQLLLRPDDKLAIRKLEDKHVKEIRDLEDKYEIELRTLRKRQAEERDGLRKTFKR